jgi:hypothetical protein
VQFIYVAAASRASAQRAKPLEDLPERHVAGARQVAFILDAERALAEERD